MCDEETKIHHTDEKIRVIQKLHERPRANMQVHRSMDDRKGPHQMDLAKMATPRPYRAQARS